MTFAARLDDGLSTFDDEIVSRPIMEDDIRIGSEIRSLTRSGFDNLEVAVSCHHDDRRITVRVDDCGGKVDFRAAALDEVISALQAIRDDIAD